MADMEVDPPETSNDKGKKDSGKKRFEVKKVRKLSAWAPLGRQCARVTELAISS